MLPPPLPACPLPPPPLPCPLPPPCFCPPPVICPPPPAPLPCPPPPPLPVCPPLSASLRPPQPCGGYQMPQMPVYAPPPSNDCCCQCGRSCKYNRAKTHGSRIYSALTAIQEDPTCNSEKLRAIILENITDDATISKRAIQAAAEEKLFAKINVICGREDFSYLVYTETFCQATNEESGITCYAFRMPTHDRYSEDL
ncbi:Ground-like domain-containing protein [Aphelenchoides fujianensis]|nr:Ground-like domain-containing protein [Aphelenchoides fujianensis]